MSINKDQRYEHNKICPICKEKKANPILCNECDNGVVSEGVFFAADRARKALKDKIVKNINLNKIEAGSGLAECLEDIK